MVHLVRLSKSGNSQVVAIPQPIRSAMHLNRGDQLVVTIERGRIVLVKVNGSGVEALHTAVKKAKS